MFVAGGVLAFEQIANGLKNARSEAIGSAESVSAAFSRMLSEQGQISASPLDNLQRSIENMKSNCNCDIMIIDADSKILGDTRKDDIGSLYHLTQNTAVGMTLNDGIPREFRDRTGTQGKEVRQVVVPLHGESRKPIGAVILDSSRFYNSEKALIFKTNATITITVLISIIFSLTMGSMLSKRVTDQTRRLEKGVREIDRGNWDYRIEHEGGDELGLLSGAFNRMASDLKSSNEQLEKRLQQLQASEMRLRLATLASHDLIWETDMKSGTATWSGDLWTFLGYSPDEVKTTWDFWKEHVHPDDIGRVISLMESATSAGKESWSTEYRLRHADGLYSDILDRAYVVYDDEKKPVRFVGAATDISQRKMAERILAEREASFRVSFTNSPHPMWVYDLETLGFLEVNDAAIDGYGYSRDEFFEMTLVDIHPPEDRARLMQNVAEERPALQHSGEWRHLRKDGSVIDVEIDSHLLEFMGRQAALVTAQDITRRKEAEKKLRESEVRFRSLIERSSDVISVIDGTGKIIYMSPSVSRMGYSVEDVTGKTALDITYPDDIPKLMEALKTILTEPDVIHTFELRFRHSDGSWRDSESVALNALNVPEIRGIVVNSRDITEKKKLEAQFLRTQRMESIGTLAGGIAHDLNNVLAPILLSLDMIRDMNPDEKSQKLVDTLEASANRGAELIKQVLSFARGIEGDRTVVQLKHLIREIEKIILETFPRSIDIVTNVPRDLRTVSGDATQLHQVMMNLCVNARDAMPSGGRIEISAENATLDGNYVRAHIGAKEGPYVVLSIADTGVGIPEPLLNRIFEPFFTTKEVGKGTGLGLSTVMTIVKSHGGFVNVYSENGKGTSFKVYLPAQVDAKPANKEKELKEKYAGNGELIMVVDDEAAVREIAKAMLEAYGYRTMLASEGEEALGLFASQKGKVALVITDMMMPKLDGIGTADALRKADPDIKIVAMSGLSKSEYDLTSIGATASLSKPFTSEALLKTVRLALTGNWKAEG